MGKRLDELLVEQGFFSNLHDAQASIMAGEVIVGEHRADTAGMQVKEGTSLRLKAGKNKGGFVSRGGIKLEHALDSFGIDVAGLNCVDLGASSGGFTDCLLQHGARHVSAIDVGSAQFDWSLRNDPRISLYEGTNIRSVSAKDIGGPFDVAVADLSFISLTAVMDDIAGFLKMDGIFVSLLKPQFEAARKDVEAGGVVRNEQVHIQCISNVLDKAMSCGLEIKGLSFSPITGPAGNIEFLFWAKKSTTSEAQEVSIGADDISQVVHTAHAQLRSNV